MAITTATRNDYWVYMKVRVQIEAEGQKDAEAKAEALQKEVDKILPKNSEWLAPKGAKAGGVGVYEIQA
jgi:hypothetical protein